MCCLMDKPKTNKKKELLALETIKKHFDVVEVVEYENYDVLECKNVAKKINAGSIQYETWLNLKIKKNEIEDFCKEFLKYKDKLFNHNNKSKTLVQTSLFEDDEPTNDKLTINDLTFWQSINDYYIYDYDDYIDDIPKTNEEMIEIVKECLTMYVKNPNMDFEKFHFDDDYSYFRTNEPISDREMLSRLYSSLKIYFGISTYVEETYSIDSSNEVRQLHSIGDKNKRFYADYYGTDYVISFDDEKSKVYDLYDKEFCTWLRKLFNIPYRKPLEDIEVIKEELINFSKRFFDENNTLESFIANSKDAKDFRKNVFSHLRKKSSNFAGHCGGGCGPLDDCYSVSYTYDINDLEIVITQLNNYRKQLGRETEENNDIWKKDSTCILNLKGNEVFESMYTYLSNKPTYKQNLLF